MSDALERLGGSEFDAAHFLASMSDPVAHDAKPARPTLPQPPETEQVGTVRVVCAGANMLLYGIIGVLNEFTQADVTWARSLDEVLRRAAAGERFDIALLDTALADLDGSEGIKRATAA